MVWSGSTAVFYRRIRAWAKGSMEAPSRDATLTTSKLGMMKSGYGRPTDSELCDSAQPLLGSAKAAASDLRLRGPEFAVGILAAAGERLRSTVRPVGRDVRAVEHGRYRLGFRRCAVAAPTSAMVGCAGAATDNDGSTSNPCRAALQRFSVGRVRAPGPTAHSHSACLVLGAARLLDSAARSRRLRAKQLLIGLDDDEVHTLPASGWRHFSPGKRA